MLDRALLPPHIVTSAQDLQNTPPAVLNLLGYLLRENMDLRRQVEEIYYTCQVIELPEIKTDVTHSRRSSTGYRRPLSLLIR